MTASQIPEGFARHFRQSPLTDPWEPLYSRRTDKAVIIGFHAAENHTNSRGFVHGGLADNAMGLSCTVLLGEGKSRLVTIGLSIDFLNIARVGQWIEIDTSFTRTGATICFAQAFVTADGRICVRANATFRVVPVEEKTS